MPASVRATFTSWYASSKYSTRQASQAGHRNCRGSGCLVSCIRAPPSIDLCLFPRLARPHPEPLPAEVDRDVAEGRVGVLNRPHQGPLAGGGLVAEQRKGAALAAGAVDLPAQ